MFGPMLANVQKKKPLIHGITNYVTANDCANVLLACKASPIMADDIGEVEEITALCNGLVLNLGTLNQRTIPSMLAAGKKANERGIPVILDPVGAGASKLRTQTAERLLEELEIGVIRGNSSELKTLAYGQGKTRGVDVDVADEVTPETLEQMVLFAKAFAGKTGAVISMTGAIDIVADATTAYCIYNGHPMMKEVTGTGCQLSALTGAFVAASPNQRLEAAAAAVCAMGICGEKAAARLREEDGNASFRTYLIDGIYRLTKEEMEREEKYEIG